MRTVSFGCVAVMVAVALSACAGEEHPADNAKGVTNMQASAPPTVQDQGWAALVEADRELNDLAAIRDRTGGAAARNDISLQMMDIRARSDRLLDDMSIGDGRVHDDAIRADVANLHRAVHAGAATEMQGQPPSR
jgi:hypothetical protein